MVCSFNTPGYLGFSISLMNSGSRVFNVSGRSQATKPDPNATAQYVAAGRRCHTSSNSMMSGEMETPSRARNEV